MKISDDGLITPEVGLWSEYDKYRLMAEYSNLFVKAMRSKWDQLVYIDLFAGAGISKIKGEERRVYGSPLLALTQECPFDGLVFCEADNEKFDALKVRVKKLDSSANVTFLKGDANSLVEDILAAIPKGSRENKVLTFCFVDPFKLANLQFNTLRKLSNIYIDFMVLIPSGMDAHRNQEALLNPGNSVLMEFTGCADWRDLWDNYEAKTEFRRFVVEIFGRSMQSLGFQFDPVENPAVVRSSSKNLYLYDLVFFSKHSLGTHFWSQSKKSASPQRKLF